MLTRYGYTSKVLTEMPRVQPSELKSLFCHDLPTDRAPAIKEQILAAVLPTLSALRFVSRIMSQLG